MLITSGGTGGKENANKKRNPERPPAAGWG